VFNACPVVGVTRTDPPDGGAPVVNVIALVVVSVGSEMREIVT